MLGHEEASYNHIQGEPSSIGKIYIGLVDKYQAEHGHDPIPYAILTAFWDQAFAIRGEPPLPLAKSPSALRP